MVGSFATMANDQVHQTNRALADELFYAWLDPIGCQVQGECPADLGLPGARVEPPDTDESNPMPQFLLHIMAAFAELEREIIRERVVAGMATEASVSARRRGTPARITLTNRIRCRSS